MSSSSGDENDEPILDRTPLRRSVRINFGITPYRGRPLARAEAISEYYETPRYKGFVRRLEREARVAGVVLVSFEQAAGIWQGSLEPAVSLELEGDVAALHQLAEQLRKRYNQDAVMLFVADEAANGAFYILEGMRDADYANEILREFGIKGGRFRFIGTRLEIADADGSLAASVRILAEELGVKLTVIPGNLEFVSR